jgi:CHAT domain-containing protein
VQPIAAAIDRWRAEFAAEGPPPGANPSDPGKELRRLIWQPLEPHLVGVNAVLVSPDGVLNRFSLAALPGSKPNTYLIEDLPLAVVPVPQLLPQLLGTSPETGGPNQPASSLLVMGDIDFGAPPGQAQRPSSQFVPAGHSAVRGSRALQFAPLAGTAAETAAIRTVFEQTHLGGTASTVRGPAATEQAFRSQAPGKRYLHLATHGFFAPPELKSVLGSPSTRSGGLDGMNRIHPGLLSGLALAGANRGTENVAGSPLGDDGILTALEVAEMDLRSADLVVLSACETGLGRVAGGEGLLGLQRAFQMAGARTVVASLWKVDDEATQELMKVFYDNLWRKQLQPLQALRQAQLSILNGRTAVGRSRGVGEVEAVPVAGKKARAHPRLWAAWVLSGAPGDSRPVSSVSPAEVREDSTQVASSDSPSGPATSSWDWRLPVAGGGLVVLVLMIWLAARHRRGS